jgi:hypothetical protein
MLVHLAPPFAGTAGPCRSSTALSQPLAICADHPESLESVSG